MAVSVIDVSRKEVQRWISAGTLGLTNENRYFRVNSDDEYYLVALTAVFATRWDAIWVPNVIETSVSFEQVEDWTRTLDEEELSELCGKALCHCFEVWHVVDEFDEYDFNRMLYGVVNAALEDVLAIECYERACTLIDESEDDFGLDSALRYVSAFERAYDIAYDLTSFYPVTTYRRKSHYALDLEELRLAGSVENV